MSNNDNSAQLDKLSLPSGYFEKKVWKRFNALSCLQILASKREAYGGLKSVLYAGFCAWMVAPTDTKLIKSALVLGALKTLSEAEKTALDGDHPRVAAADIVARVAILGPQFFEEIYYPMGGALGLARAPSIKDYKLAISSHFPRIDYAITILQIYQDHVLKLYGQPRYGRPSLNKAVELIAPMGIRHGDHLVPTKTRYLKDAWAQNRETAALLYAAQSIQTKNGITFLDKIRSCKNNYASDQILLPTLLSRTKWIAEEILSKCVETETSDLASWIVPRGFKKEPLPEAPFSEEQRETIRRAFSRSAV